MSTCYYLQRNGTALEIGKGPSLAAVRRAACVVSDGVDMAFFGGNYRGPNDDNLYYDDMRLLASRSSTWEAMEGDGLRVGLGGFSSERLGR